MKSDVTSIMGRAMLLSTRSACDTKGTNSSRAGCLYGIGRKVGIMPSSRREALIAEYAEVSSNFRKLTDIRFKLLAFLPLAAGVAASVLARGNATALTLAFSLFGLVVTIGLLTYERNDQLYEPLWLARQPSSEILASQMAPSRTAHERGSG